MKLKAKVDILFDCKRFKAGSELETDERTSQTLVQMGWADVVEEIKVPKKTTKKSKK